MTHNKEINILIFILLDVTLCITVSFEPTAIIYDMDLWKALKSLHDWDTSAGRLPSPSPNLENGAKHKKKKNMSETYSEKKAKWFNICMCKFGLDVVHYLCVELIT